MLLTPSPTEASRLSLHESEHHTCFACGSAAVGGLGLRFQFDPATGEVCAQWDCAAHYRSYDGTLHGGLIATLLDSAMVHALFARDIIAHTAELRLRYLHPVATETPVTITANLSQHFGRLFQLHGTVSQGARLCARADAKFMRSRP